jgi:hypothetical protein
MHPFKLLSKENAKPVLEKYYVMREYYPSLLVFTGSQIKRTFEFKKQNEFEHYVIEQFYIAEELKRELQSALKEKMTLAQNQITEKYVSTVVSELASNDHKKSISMITSFQQYSDQTLYCIHDLIFDAYNMKIKIEPLNESFSSKNAKTSVFAEKVYLKYFEEHMKLHEKWCRDICKTK